MKLMNKDIAIQVNNLSKTFCIPHEKISSLRGAFISAFRKKTYEEFRALDDISFEVKKGEFFGIIGRNGSGKSTLLKILAGIYQPNGGKVRISGLISPFLELGIGFNPELSGRDNVYLNATVLGMSKKQIDQKFDDIVTFSELERFIDQKLKNYSSGMSVRLAFSVAIHANREILLMDEVLAVGDSNFQSKCLEEFNRYKKLGKTVILVSHDIFTIQRYCDNAMLLRDGKIIKIGKANGVVNEYIEENMDEEEKRISGAETDEKVENSKENDQSETIKNDGKKYDRSAAKIIAVNFFDENGNKRNIFETGKSINIEVQYKITKSIKDPIFGIIIKGANGMPIFITNTQFKKIKTGNVKSGITKVSFKIDNCLATGTHSVSPAIANESATIFFDWRDDFKQFNVINKEYNSSGICDLNHSIIIK